MKLREDQLSKTRDVKGIPSGLVFKIRFQSQSLCLGLARGPMNINLVCLVVPLLCDSELLFCNPHFATHRISRKTARSIYSLVVTASDLKKRA